MNIKSSYLLLPPVSLFLFAVNQKINLGIILSAVLMIFILFSLWFIDKKISATVNAMDINKAILLPVLSLWLVLIALIPIDFPPQWPHFLGRFRIWSFISIFVFIYFVRLNMLSLILSQIKKIKAYHIFLIFFLPSIFLGFSNHIFRYINGDEPGYLLTTISLVEDGDINVSNNISNHLLTDYIKGSNKPGSKIETIEFLNNIRFLLHNATLYKNQNQWISYFCVEPLLSYLWVIPFFLAGLYGVIFFQIMFYALGLNFLVLYLKEKHDIDYTHSIPIFFATLLVFPLISYIGRFYAEMNVFAFFSAFLYFKDKKGFYKILAWALISAIPWLHIRFILIPCISIIYHLFLILRKRISFKENVYGFVVFLMVLSSLIIYNKQIHFGLYPGGYSSPYLKYSINTNGRDVLKIIDSDLVRINNKENKVEIISLEECIESFSIDAIENVRRNYKEPDTWTDIKQMIKIFHIKFGRFFQYLIGGSNGLIFYLPILFIAICFFLKMEKSMTLPIISYLIFISIINEPTQDLAPARYAIAIVPFLLSGLVYYRGHRWLIEIFWFISSLIALYKSVFYSYELKILFHKAFFVINSNEELTLVNLTIIFAWIVLFILVKKYVSSFNSTKLKKQF